MFIMDINMDSESWMLVAVVAAVLVAMVALGAIGYLLMSEWAGGEPRGPTRTASVMVVLGSGGHTAEMLTLVRQLGDSYTPRHYVLASSDKMSEDKVRRLEDDRELGDRVIESTKGGRVAESTNGENISEPTTGNGMMDSSIDDQLIDSTKCRARTCSSKVASDSQDNNSDLHSSVPARQAYTISKIPRSRSVSQSWASTVLTTLYAGVYSFPLVWRLIPDVILCNGPGTCIPICVAAIILKPFRTVTVVYVESVCRVETLSLSGKILYYLADEMFVQWPTLQKKYPKTKYLGRLV